MKWWWLALLLCVRCATAAEPQELFLEVSMNGEPSGQVVGFRQGARGLRASTADLRLLGVMVPTAEDVDLADVPGLAYNYDAATQTIALQVVDALRTPYQLAARAAQRVPAASASPGAIFNYNAMIQLDGRRSALVANEWRLFGPRGAFSTSGIARAGTVGAGYTRYDTFWSESDPETLRSFQAGDTVTSALGRNRSIRIGGLQWSKSFALRPDITTFPTPSIGGSALVPSALSLYVNGVQQYSASVPSGPFVLDQVAGVNGAGNAVLVTRDALGRSTSVTVPMYVNARMLAPGLSDYSIEVGAPRRGYGADSFGYQRELAASATARIGISRAVTLDGHAEMASGLVNAGAGGLLALGRAGVVNASLGASGGRLTGLQAGAGYQYLAPRFSIDAQLLRASEHYGDLAARDGSPAPRRSDHLTLAFALPRNQSASVSYVGYSSPLSPPARLLSLGMTSTIGSGLFLSVSAFGDLNRPASRGAFASLSMAFGDRLSASAVAGRQNGVAQRSASLVSAPEMTGGAGWSLGAGAIGDIAYRAANAQYLGRYGQAGATIRSSSGRSAAMLDADGALVMMDGVMAPTRRSGEGFALVSTDGVAGVPVLHENRVVGVTDQSGHLLVPNLNVNGSNQIAIDTSDLSADLRVRAPAATLNPRRFSGVLARFALERYRAANVILQDAHGAAPAVGTRVHHLETGAESIVGYDGVAFIENLGADNHIEVGEGAQRCIAHFAFADTAGELLPVIGPLRCVSGEAPR